jgi:serine/threonine protein kinase/CRP-like cAMP-binding protein
MSASSDDYTSDSGESGTLICGFGPRPSRGGSNDLGDSANRSSLICGFGDGGNSVQSGSTSSGDIVGKNYDVFIDTTNYNTACDVALPSTEDGTGVHVHELIPVGTINNGPIQKNHHESRDVLSTYVVQTKTEGNGNCKMGIPRNWSNNSLGGSFTSECDLSILSEDAIVMMLNAIDDEHENDFPDDDVCGNVFKGRHNNDYESIPIEVKYDADDFEKVWTPAPKQKPNPVKFIPSRNESHHSDVGGSEESSKFESPQLTKKSILKPQRLGSNPDLSQDAQQQRNGEKLAPTKQVLIFDTATKAATDNNGGILAKGRDRVGSRSAVSFQPINENSTAGFSSAGSTSLQMNRSSSFSRLGSIQEDDSHLSVINEDSSSCFTNSATTTMSEAASIAALSMASKGEKNTKHDNWTTLGGVVEQTVSTDREQILDPSSRVNAPTKGKVKSQLKEESGRHAVVSRDASSYVKLVVPKPESVAQLIRDAIATNILFKACSSEELTELVQVFAPSEATAGCTIIREGDEGDAFYVMEKGTVDVYVGDEYKSTLYSGASFGEIALLYNCPRSATLRSRYFCKLWSISRTAFRAITSQFKQRRMEAKCEFLRKVKIKDKFLGDVLSESEINTLALATLNESYEAGHTIVREGDPGDIFYMIDSGSVDVYVNAKGEFPIATLSSGQFFGELALLSTLVRTASCVAKTDVTCHILMRDDFNLLLGDLQSLMAENHSKRDDEASGPTRDSKISLQVNLADLDILHVLGIGAFGRVSLAKLKNPIPGIKNDAGFFALKCISKQCLQENGLNSHIQNEKAIMSELDHPFINRYYCDMEDDKYIYFLLEALPGGELCKRLHVEKVFPEPWGKFYSASVLFAFCHMHSKKIAYRDLKPENLVMDSVGYVKVVDFGLAKVITGGKTWTLCGTPAYLAPEIVLNDGHDWSVDYWALGVFLFEMTSGKEPFAAKNPMEVYKKIISGNVDIPPYFTSQLTDLIRKLLNTSKSKRLGRTMGGGGAVMQHNWYSDFDWDAHLEKRLEAPLPPKTLEVLTGDSATVASVSDSKDSSNQSSSSQSKSKEKQKIQGPVTSAKPPRLTYSLGQGNRHHQKMLEIMDSGNDSDRHVDHANVVRMTMMRVIKQHERWSKTSRESSINSYSSTRNTSLNVGSKLTARDSIDTESGISTTSSGCENDALIRLQTMHLALPSNCPSLKVERGAYQQFSLISFCEASVKSKKSEVRSCGYRFLDPFITKKYELIDQYSKVSSKTDIDSDALAAFCFPNGLRIRLVPRCAIEGAKRLGWLGNNGDSYQLQGFTDVAGALSHGCAITIKEELKSNRAHEVLFAITFQRKMRRSAKILARWWIKQNMLRKSRPKPKIIKAASMVERASSFMVGRRVQLINSERSIRISASEVRKNNIRATSFGDLGADSDDDTSDDSRRDNGTAHSERVRRLAISAYQAMIDADKEGDICIVEKCYVLTGTRLQEQSLLFCALQNLINMERKLNDVVGRKSGFNRLDTHGSRGSRAKNLREESKNLFDSDSRHAVLSALQVKLSLTQDQRKICHPRNDVAYITAPQRHFVMDLSITEFDKVCLPLPLPEVSGQWGLSTLITRIKDSGLIILLKLLLLERSVLVVGETPEEVTACSTVLLELLEPYKWASAFMPLLPREMLDFVSSPVPFIAGMIVEGKHQMQSIIHDHSVKDAMLHGLSLVDLASGKLIVTREQGTSDMLRRSFQAIPELSLYQKRLEDYWKYPCSNLRSFQAFFRYGASRSESLTLQKIKEVIRRYISQFTVGLTDKPDAWQQYGEFNESAGTFDFSPDKFIQPLKDRMIFQIQFQEMMAHTQLFVGFVEELQLSHEKRNELLSGPAAEVIATWIETHWNADKFRKSINSAIR